MHLHLPDEFRDAGSSADAHFDPTVPPAELTVAVHTACRTSGCGSYALVGRRFRGLCRACHNKRRDREASEVLYIAGVPFPAHPSGWCQVAYAFIGIALFLLLTGAANGLVGGKEYLP